MSDFIPFITPMEYLITLTDLVANPIDSTLYRQCLRSGMYLSVGTRLDIAFAVSNLIQFVETITQPLWTAAKRIMPYIAGKRQIQPATATLIWESSTSKK
eukprot:IDg18672t1